MHISFQVEEWHVSIRWSLLRHPIDYEHGDDIYVLSGGLMLEGCESHPVNLNAEIRHISDDSVGIVWLSFDEALQVFDHIQIITSAWPIQNSHGFSPQHALGIRSPRRAWLHRAWTWLVLQRVVAKVWHSQGPRRNSTKRSCLLWISTNGSLQFRERCHYAMTEASA